MARTSSTRTIVGVVAVLVVVVVALAVVITWRGGSVAEDSQDADTAKPPHDGPNFVVVMTDDLAWADIEHLPAVEELLTAQGRTFDQYMLSVPVCCPSRTTMFRGQYAHNTGVLRNAGEDGGWPTAFENGLEADMLGPAMQAAGYRTGLYGRYLNGYPRPGPVTYVPPGWNDWSVPILGINASYGYTFNENGVLVEHGEDEADYIGDVLFDEAIDYLQTGVGDDSFFVWINAYAPHYPAEAAPRHLDSFDGIKAPQPPNYNEADVSDKPQYIQDANMIRAGREQLIDQVHEDRVESLQSVDEGVARLIATLEATGQLDDTYVIFSSDNGYHMGNHRLLPGKGSPYEEDVRVPLVVRGPGIPAGSRSDALVGNVDLYPTLASLGGAAAPAFIDGRDVSTALAGSPTERKVFLLEHWQKDLSRLDDGDPDFEPEVTPGGDASIPDYVGLRSAGWKYVRYTTDERELYDLTADPFELVNLAQAVPPETITALDDFTDALGSCAEATCRTLEEQTPPFPGAEPTAP